MRGFASPAAVRAAARMPARRHLRTNETSRRTMSKPSLNTLLQDFESAQAQRKLTPLAEGMRHPRGALALEEAAVVFHG